MCSVDAASQAAGFSRRPISGDKVVAGNKSVGSPRSTKIPGPRSGWGLVRRRAPYHAPIKRAWETKLREAVFEAGVRAMRNWV